MTNGCLDKETGGLCKPFAAGNQRFFAYAQNDEADADETVTTKLDFSSIM